MNTVLADAGVVTGWRKSGRCDNSGPNCVEVARHNGQIAVRNSTNPNGPALLFTEEEIGIFFGGVKDGTFDDLTAG